MFTALLKAIVNFCIFLIHSPPVDIIRRRDSSPRTEWIDSLDAPVLLNAVFMYNFYYCCYLNFTVYVDGRFIVAKPKHVDDSGILKLILLSINLAKHQLIESLSFFCSAGALSLITSPLD